MSRYINADSLVDYIENRMQPNDVINVWEVVEMIEHTPTEHLMPWIEGKWTERKITMFIPGGKPYFRYEQECSNCGFINKSKKRWNSNFCPYCGAKMEVK